MTIRLYDTKTKRKQDFVPIDPKDVRMYVCGPTVYDRAHIGNARPVVVFDVLYRLLRHEYGAENVRYARNFTDVDDKINAKAAETGRSIRDITNETIGWYHEDMDALGALRPTHEPRATEYIAPMVTMIEGLIASGNAYEAEGHVLFAVATDPEYGTLSRRSLDEMRAGARVEVAPYKRDPMDFVLWKPSTGEQPGWDSPWGKGRPGWHIECSAMAGELLGEKFDIHGGGIDLQFPHHENECAQSRCAGHDFANIWMHNGFLTVEGEKMSKSLGNFFTVEDMKNGIPGEVMRFVLLTTQYRKPLDWTEKRVEDARNALSNWIPLCDQILRDEKDELGAVSKAVLEALSDDLNTPLAIASLHSHANEIEKSRSVSGARDLVATLEFLGFDTERVQAWSNLTSLKEIFLENEDPVSFDRIQKLIDARADAKTNKDFAKADALRNALVNAGVDLKDTPQGSTYSLTSTYDPAKLPEIEDV